jgi:antitoxin HicB
MLDYPVILETDADTGVVLVTFPDIHFCHTVGNDEEEALLNAIDALETALGTFVEARQPLPIPSTLTNLTTVRPSALEGAKLEVYRAMTEQGVKKAELARRLGWHMPQVDKLFDLRHISRLEQIEAAARALGLKLRIEFVRF